MFGQVRQCLVEGALWRHVDGLDDQLLGVLALTSTIDSVDKVLMLGTGQYTQCSHEADGQLVAQAVPEAQALQLLVGIVQNLFIPQAARLCVRAREDFDDS